MNLKDPTQVNKPKLKQIQIKWNVFIKYAFKHGIVDPEKFSILTEADKH
ncbi:36852_t:CDS:1, partial [Gigaspora margarita]